MLEEGLEPSRGFRLFGFSYHYGFRHPCGLWSGLSLGRRCLPVGLSRQVSTPSPATTGAWLGIAATIARRAAVPPTSTEFTRRVSHSGAQILKSDASAVSATPAWPSLY